MTSNFFSILIGLVFVTITSCTSMTSQTISRSSEFDIGSRSCSSDSKSASLDLRSSESDVILTGTILKIMPEVPPRGIEPRTVRSAGQSHGRTVTGHVKVWSVMKGSIDDISDKIRTYRRRKRSAERRHHKRDAGEQLLHKEKGNKTLHTPTHMRMPNYEIATSGGKKKPVVELHGIRNSLMCGSFLNEGDTRVFFLRKMRDHREPRIRRRRNSTKRNNRRRKGKKNKRRRSKKRNKMAKKHSNDVTPSVGATWKKLARKHKSKRRESKVRVRSSSKSPSVLLVSSEPARISLKNLNNVETILKAKK